jgi:hypothetical protein
MGSDYKQVPDIIVSLYSYKGQGVRSVSTSEYCSGLVKPNPRTGRRKHNTFLKFDFQPLFISTLLYA